MKKAKISLLAMTALFLVGCNRRTPVTSKSSSSEPKTTQTTTKKPTTTSKPTTSKPTDGKTTTAKPTTPATTDIYHSTKWDKEIVDLMLEHLNGNIVPYAEIAENNIYLVPEWDETYLDLNIYGDPFSPEHVSNAAISFQAAGWDVVAEANSMKATLASQNLEVEVHEVTDYGDYKGLTVLTARWYEPYDSSKLTSWSQDIKDLFTSNLHGHELPLIYLGTATPVGQSLSSQPDSMSVLGGRWDDRVITENKTLLENAGWNTSDVNQTGMTATKVEEDGCTLTVVFSRTVSSKRAQFKAYFVEKFDPNVKSDWEDATKTLIANNMDNHEVTYVYLGKTVESASLNYKGDEITIVGGKWNEGVFAEAERVLKNDGYSEIKKTPAGSLDRSDNLTATKLFGDSCIFKVTLKSDNNNKVYLAVEYTEGYVAPTGEDAKWSDDIKSKMKTALNDYVIPYFYMGTKAPTISTSTSDPVLTVTGANWRNEILENAKSALEADGFKTSTQEGDYARTLVASKRILTADKNDVVFVSLTKNYSSKAEMKVYYQNATGVSFDNSKSYSEEDQATFVEVTKEVAPYLDMGTPSISYKGDTYLQVKGSDGSYSLAALNNVYDTLNTNGYTSNYFLNGSSIEVRATKERADHSLLTLKYTKYSGTAAYYELHYFPPFVAPKGDAAKWSDAIISIFNDNFSGHVLPYVYLGIDEPTYSWNSSSRNLTINGKTWNDSIWKSFEDTYSADDYELVWDYSSKDKALLASKTFSDGVLVTVKLTKNGDTPRLDCFVR